MPDASTIKSRRKKARPEMYPVKEWLSTEEAAAYLDISINEIGLLAKEHSLTTATLRQNGKKLYYKVSELKGIFEKNRLFQQ